MNKCEFDKQIDEVDQVLAQTSQEVTVIDQTIALEEEERVFIDCVLSTLDNGFEGEKNRNAARRILADMKDRKERNAWLREALTARKNGWKRSNDWRRDIGRFLWLKWANLRPA